MVEVLGSVILLEMREKHLICSMLPGWCHADESALRGSSKKRKLMISAAGTTLTMTRGQSTAA
eukprot:1157028-Pelagomonas_calceolata.AAC.3